MSNPTTRAVGTGSGAVEPVHPARRKDASTEMDGKPHREPRPRDAIPAAPGRG